jgi:hypothetical protein
MGQVKEVYEEIIHNMVKEIDLGKDLESTLKKLSEVYGEVWFDVSGDVYKVLIDKSEAEAYDKIRMDKPGEGLKAYGIMYRWFSLRVRSRRAGEKVNASGPSQEGGGSFGERGSLAG